MAQINIKVGLNPQVRKRRVEQIKVVRKNRSNINTDIVCLEGNTNIALVKGISIKGVSGRNKINKRRELIVKKVIVD